jgi:DNA-binding beta-propeller fold protein YncE
VWITAQDTGRLYVLRGQSDTVDTVELPPPPGASSPSPHFARSSPSGKYVYVPALHSGKVYVIRAQDRQLVATIPTPDSAAGNVNSNPAVGPNGLGAHDAAPSPDGDLVLVAHWGTNLLYKVSADEDAESWQIVDSASIGARPICIVYHPSESKAYIGTAPSGIAVIDLADLSVDKTFATPGAWSCSWAQARDGQTMYLSTNDPVGLASQRSQPLHLLRVGDLDLPTLKLEPVVHEAGAVHRLDRRPDRLAVTCEPLTQATQPVGVGRRCADLDGRALTVEQVEVETLATEIQTGVQHRNGPPLDSSQTTNRSLSSGEALLHGIPYHEVSGRHARARAVTRDTVFRANRSLQGADDASQDVASVVSDVSVLCPRRAV